MLKKKNSLLTRSEEALIFYVFSITMTAARPDIEEEELRQLFGEWPEEEKLEIINFAMERYNEYKNGNMV